MPRRYSIVAIHGSLIIDGTITTQKLADLAVTTPKLANQAVTNQKLAPAAIKVPIVRGSIDVQIMGGTQYYLAPSTLDVSFNATDGSLATVTMTINELWVGVKSNSFTGSTPVTLLKNGSATDKAISIPASTTGVFSETSTTVSLQSTDSYVVRFSPPGGTGGLSISSLYIYQM
jgi:hypothetical protein